MKYKLLKSNSNFKTFFTLEQMKYKFRNEEIKVMIGKDYLLFLNRSCV